jgi:signal transduction histidine kinase
MAEQLQTAFATQQAFVADASHELRTLLTALGGQLDVLRGLVTGQSAEADQLIDRMRRDSTRMARMAEDLLVLTARCTGVRRTAAAEVRPDVGRARRVRANSCPTGGV